MSVVAYHGRLQVIGSEYGRHASQMFEAHPDCEDEVLRLLRGNAYRIGVVATPVRDKKPKENLVISIIFRIFVGENQTFTNNKKRLPNDFKGQSYRIFLYY